MTAVQVAVDELQPGVGLERAGFNGTVVLDPAQAVMTDGDVGGCGSHDGTSIVARKPSPCGPAWIRPHPASIETDSIHITLENFLVDRESSDLTAEDLVFLG